MHGLQPTGRISSRRPPLRLPDWALNDLLAARLDAPHRFHLEHNPRRPSRIAERLDEVERLVVITVADEKPVCVPERLGDMVC